MLDPGPLPRDTAASTDISKVVRIDYGADEFYTELGEAALAGWHAWNQQWGEPLYHECGFLLLSRHSMDAPGYERDSFELLSRRGHPMERLTSAAVATRYPAWTRGGYIDGYYNPRAGWVESGAVIARLVAQARSEGVTVRDGAAFDRLLESGSRVGGVVTADGVEHRADGVLIAAGAWTSVLLPHLDDVLWATAQPVLHFQAPRVEELRPPGFPVWAADIERTGWYGFPALADGRLKISNHGPGRRVHPDEPRVVLPEEEARFHEFLHESLPARAGRRSHHRPPALSL